jgi:hypothetical protein
VSWASRLAKVCWAEVSIVPAWAGRLPVALVAVLPVMALDSCEENDIDAPVDPVELVLLLVLVVACGVKAVARLESSVLIVATRAVTSEMLIFSSDHRRLRH